jgi:uncharacterized protein (DUF433 family)
METQGTLLDPKEGAMGTDAVIEYKAGAGGKSPVIKGTRVRVSDIAVLYRIMRDEVVVERIQKSLPHLTTEQIQAAIDYWRENQDEVQDELAQERRILAGLPAR